MDGVVLRKQRKDENFEHRKHEKMSKENQWFQKKTAKTPLLHGERLTILRLKWKKKKEEELTRSKGRSEMV
ncbi:hypothetical protein Csa_004861 [Cucumis sativus]|uniref:Uncharacterized protein n=1 Tax=Cucumis sativus TaxID=3659 RepID=A0A0A0KC73_CUCSA|nr:hypothetical protein Csa_004861 [Cucumis sativus]